METDPGTLLYLESPEIEALGLAAARSTPSDYELLTDAWLEFKRRGREAKAGAYERKLAELGSAPVSWLPKARGIAKQFRRRCRGNHHVYVIPLDGYLAGGERYGLYIWETSKAVSVRFEEHVSRGPPGGAVSQEDAQVDQQCVSLPSYGAPLKPFHPARENISQNWTMAIGYWKAALNRFTIQLEGRIPQA